MENLWVDIENEYMAHNLDLFPAEFTITEMDTVLYKGQYYRFDGTQVGSFRKLVPIDDQQLDDFDLGPQCEEYYIEE